MNFPAQAFRGCDENEAADLLSGDKLPPQVNRYLDQKMPQGYRSGSRYTTPYDSTHGLPDGLFIGFWIIILLFCLRLAWEYRDKIFKKRDLGVNSNQRNSGKKKRHRA